jgi:hypothetical protein
VIGAVDWTLHLGSYGWVPGTPGHIEVPLVNLGSPSTVNLPATTQILRGAAVLVDIHENRKRTSSGNGRYHRATTVRAGAAALPMPSEKSDRMVYTSAWGFYPHGPLPVLSLDNEDARFLRRLLAKGPVRLSLDVQSSFDNSRYRTKRCRQPSGYEP